MTRLAARAGRLVRRAAVLAAAVLTVSHAMPAAEAAFTSAGTASSGVTTHTLSTPVLGCSGGVFSVTLTWPSVSSATTLDPYAGVANSYLADGYQIHRAPGTSGGSFTLLTSPGRTATSYVDSPSVGTYRYQILTRNEGWTSPFSNQVTAVVAVATVCS